MEEFSPQLSVIKTLYALRKRLTDSVNTGFEELEIEKGKSSAGNKFHSLEILEINELATLVRAGRMFQRKRMRLSL